MQKFKKGDEVVVLTGRDKGRKGIVLSRVGDSLLLVEGVNILKRSVKPNPMKGVVGGVVSKSAPINQSNVALFDVASGAASRSHVSIDANGKRVRVLKKSSGTQLAS